MAKWRGGDDHRHAAGDVVEDRAHARVSRSSSRQHELLGEVGQDADAVGAGVDHEVDGALLALEVELAAVVEDGRRDREDAAIGADGCRADMVSAFMLAVGSVVVARHGRAAAADQEVEVGALVGLQHVVDVELHVAARRHAAAAGVQAARRGGQLRLVHMQVQAARRARRA